MLLNHLFSAIFQVKETSSFIHESNFVTKMWIKNVGVSTGKREGLIY